MNVFICSVEFTKSEHNVTLNLLPPDLLWEEEDSKVIRSSFMRNIYTVSNEMNKRSKMVASQLHCIVLHERCLVQSMDTKIQSF